MKLQYVLHSEIPLTVSIGIEVLEYDENSLTLIAPLDKNTNHKNTAFGGSLYSVSVLTGWGLIYLLLEKHHLTGFIVIQESNTRFIKPVTSSIKSTCSFDSETQTSKFLSMYKRKGKARIKLESRIACNGEPSVIFTGTYVVHR